MIKLLSRMRQSFSASAGDVVFGMEDGAVSIFGLVFGVAATTNQNAHVLVAGITGAFAAAVSMMAGVFLDRQSEADQRRVQAETMRALEAGNPERAVAEIEARLTRAGFDAPAAAIIIAEARARPRGLDALANATLLPTLSPSGMAVASPTAHAMWMLVSDLFASLVPVVPFALLSMADARIASIVLTAALMLMLGAWRARLGRRRALPTALTTLAIAAAAGAVGLVTGQLVDGWLGSH
jgi:VIT1/CCC1 family predicted Fe2+/Mn2+ transporter